MLIVAVIVFGLLAVASLRAGALKPYGFSLWVLATGALAAAQPSWFTTWNGFELKQTIAPLVQLVLFGMGMTLTFDDFRRVLRMPRAIGVGMILQFTILPLVAVLCVGLFGLEGGTAAGLILIGSVPGGTASNVVTYLAKANVPLSISMTACSTLMAPLMTPLVMKLLAGTYVPIDVAGMVFSILSMVIVPLLLGILVHRYLTSLARWLTIFLPGIAMAGICFIIGITIALSHDALIQVGPAIFGAAVCMNLSGLALGYLGAKSLGLNTVDSRTVAIEVGMQNGGMATGLAFNVLKDPLAALGAAIFGPFSAVATSILASWWGGRPIQDEPTSPKVPLSSRGPIDPS